MDTTTTRVTVGQARDLLQAGKRLRIVIGPGADDPTIVLSLREGMVMCESVAGWSAGVVEPACGIDSDYLSTYFDKPIEVLEPDAPAWPVMSDPCKLYAPAGPFEVDRDARSWSGSSNRKAGG